MGNNTTEKIEKVQAFVNGVVISVIDCALGQPVGAAVLESAKVVFR
ncbi:MAG TPA: hypothetical protein VJ810_13090 [Blastocatellia bacterium]|nr:hypothetical protein [Blastocatellia bacterium]